MTGRELDVFVGEQIRAHRKQRGLSQVALAMRMGFASNGTISRWERGCNPISLANLLAVSNALGQPLTAFLPGGDR